MKPTKVKDYRRVALEIYRLIAGYRCVRCSDPVRLPDDGTLWKMGKEYVLTHTHPCKPRR